MTNLAISIKGKNEVLHFLQNCVRKGNRLEGENRTLNLRPHLYDFVWTNEIVNVGDTMPEPSEEPIEHELVSKASMVKAMKRRKEIALLTESQVDSYIENNITDLPSAKEYLKKLSKVVLAMIKIQDHNK